MATSKILFIIDSLRSGGKERRLVELVLYLKQLNLFDLYLIILNDEIHYKEILKSDIKIIIIKRSKLKKDPRIFYKIFKEVKQINPNIIHSWGIMASFYAILSKILLKKPLISNLIADTKKTYTTFSISNFFFLTTSFFANIIISNSKQGLISYNILKKGKVIYNGVSLDRFKIEEIKENIIKKNNLPIKFLITMTASFSNYKNYNLFLDLAKHINLKNSEVFFIAIGQGNNFNSITDRIKNENIENVILVGKRNDVEELVYASEIGILLTYSEGISNAIIEYMALGKPVITNDIHGGSKELIENNKSGYIVSNDIEEISNKILLLYSNEKLRIQMGNEGRLIIEQKFTIERMANEYISVYKKYLND